jgi:hypothetical protein
LQAEIERLRQSDPALGWSHPQWLVDRWRKRWGTHSTRALLEWNNRPAETFARVNTLLIDPGQLLDRWRMEEKVAYDFVRADWLEESSMFRLESHPPLTALGSFRDGWFYVQDPSTLLAVAALDPQPGDRILDLCAAPGGKATAIAQRVANQALVVARDTVASRLDRVRENCTRLGAKCVVTELTEPNQAGAKLDCGSTASWWMPRARIRESSGAGSNRVGACPPKPSIASPKPSTNSSSRARPNSNPVAPWSTAPAAWNRRKMGPWSGVSWPATRDRADQRTRALAVS